MINYLIHKQDINRDFISFYQALYMQREWGVQLGYGGGIMWKVTMDKQLLDHQVLTSVDCNNELFTASQGSVDYSCCSSGSTYTTSSTQVNCCPAGYAYNPYDGKCYLSYSAVPADPVPCPCCPDGYNYYSPTGLCVKSINSDATEPIDCVPRCIDGLGAVSEPFACPDLVAASVVISGPGLGELGLCCETMVTPWDNCGSVSDHCNDQWDPRNRHLG